MRLYCTICFTPFASLSPVGKSWFLVTLLHLQGCLTQVLCHWPHDPAEAGWARGPGSPWREGTDHLHLIPQERVSNRLTLHNVQKLASACWTVPNTAGSVSKGF